MKRVRLKTDGHIKSLDIFHAAVSYPGKEGVNYAEMEKRLRLFDVIDKAMKDGAEEIVLEDADHSRLVALFDQTPFVIVHPDFRVIADNLKGAES